MVCLCSVYPYRIANLGLAVIEGLIDTDDSPFTDDIERLSGRVHWCLCSRSIGWSSRGGGEEMDGRQCRRPRRQEWVVPPHRSGNGSTETRRATPNHHYRRTDGGDLRCWVLPTSRSWSRILEHWCVELIKHGSVKKNHKQENWSTKSSWHKSEYPTSLDLYKNIYNTPEKK